MFNMTIAASLLLSSVYILNNFMETKKSSQESIVKVLDLHALGGNSELSDVVNELLQLGKLCNIEWYVGGLAIILDPLCHIEYVADQNSIISLDSNYRSQVLISLVQKQILLIRKNTMNTIPGLKHDIDRHCDSIEKMVFDMSYNISQAVSYCCM